MRVFSIHTEKRTLCFTEGRTLEAKTIQSLLQAWGLKASEDTSSSTLGLQVLTGTLLLCDMS